MTPGLGRPHPSDWFVCGWRPAVIEIMASSWPGRHSVPGGNMAGSDHSRCGRFCRAASTTWARARGVAAWGSRVKTPGPGPVLPRLSAALTTQLLSGRLPARRRWINAWSRVWGLPWRVARQVAGRKVPLGNPALETEVRRLLRSESPLAPSGSLKDLLDLVRGLTSTARYGPNSWLLRRGGLPKQPI